MLDVRKNNLITRLCADVELPKMYWAEQHFDESHIPPEKIPELVYQQMSRPEILEKIRPGMSIAISSGSRGVANIALVTKSLVQFLKERGAKPFVFPAMGSHGGATAEGQKEVLASYGITEENIGCPIRATMETVQVGTVPDERNMPVFSDKYAHAADGIILVGRIKAHTAFRGPFESGLVKMSVIGMGKQHGAETVHESGFANMARILPKVGRVVFDNNPILCGIGLIENAFDETWKLLALTPNEIWEKETELLQQAKAQMGHILLNDLDVLVVNKIGKDISGDGMDPNVTGRYACPETAGVSKNDLRAQRIVVLGLTEETHHNANGIGMADITTRRIVDDTDLDITYPNSLTSTVLNIVKIPFVTECDRTAVQLGIRTCNMIDKKNPRIVQIQDTMHLGKILISESLLKEAEENPNMKVLGPAEAWKFNEDGNLW